MRQATRFLVCALVVFVGAVVEVKNVTAQTVSNDAKLKSLVPSVGTFFPAFVPSRPGNAVYVPYSVETITLTPTANEPHAVITFNNTPIPSGQPSAAIPLAVGLNKLSVVVTAQDGKTTIPYDVKAIRAVPTPDWVQVMAKGPFTGRDSAGELVFDNRLWIFGGYTPKLVSDVWSSPDGVQWTQAGDIPSPSGVNIPLNFAFKGRMWVTGQDGVLYASRDGAAWEAVNKDAPWKGRYGAAGAVFKDRMWVMGGLTRGTLFNDVWSSADGVEWTRECEHAPWSPRQLFSMVAVHQDKLWVVGGGITSYQPFRGYTDVWNSSDGKTWTQVTDQAPWPGRIWSTCIAYRNRLWVLGGYRAEPASENFGDVWYSSDGVTWKRLVSEHLWVARHEHSVYVHNDTLWVVAGNTWPLVNDAWSLRIPGLTFLTQPVVEEYAGAEYTYRAEADFNASAGPVHYRLTEAPDWLKVDAARGVVRGIPPSVGEYKVILEASDASGETARQTCTLHVRPAP